MMGMNTVIHILNDGFHELEEDPKGFVETIRQQMNEPIGSEYRFLLGPHGNVIKVMPYHHASDERYYISGGNTISEVSMNQADEYIEKGFGKQYIKTLERLIRWARETKKYTKEKLDESV